MKTISRKQVFLLIVCAAVLVYSMVQIAGVGDHLQYVTPAPAPVQSMDPDHPTRPNQALLDLSKGLDEAAGEWAETMTRWSLSGVIEQATLTAADADGGSATGRLTCFGKYGQELTPLLLRYGRLMYPEELEDGERVIILDEQLALAIFRVGDPIGRNVVLNGAKYQVIGVARHAKKVGDTQPGGAYVPYMSVIDQDLQLDVLQIEAAPKSGVGANVSFRTVAEAWRSGGTLIDLGKESMGAWLWLRVTGFLAGMILLLRGIHLLNGSVSYFSRRVKQRLQSAYAVRLMPWMTWRILLFAAAYALCVGAFAVLMGFILEPVYVFPEWIPSVLVEWSDINDVFWKVWQGFATMRELRTPELMRLRFFTLIVDGFSALLAVLLASVYARWSNSAERTEKSIAALYRQGVVVSQVRTTRPIAFEDLGYTECEGMWQGKRPAVPMVRIINARRVLDQLTPSAKDGSFVIEITDAQIEQNNRRWLIECKDKTMKITEAERDWDLQVPVQTLARIVYGTQTFQEFTESNTGYDMKMRSPAMDGLFGHHLDLQTEAK